MNKVAQSERKHIAVIGSRNSGKSSLVNRLIGQDLVIVSDVPGTTTDPVKKAMELLPFGPVVLIDTAGIDDSGELGGKRVEKTIKIIGEADFAILVLDASLPPSNAEIELINHLNIIEMPFYTVINKADKGVNFEIIEFLTKNKLNYSSTSCRNNSGVAELKEKLTVLLPSEIDPPLISDLVKQHDLIVLVVPIDLGAPKGRLIMPQVQTIREALDEDAIVLVTKDKELRAALGKLAVKPKLVVTDSQAIMRVAADVPEDIPLTTFSILMARYKGDLREYVKGIIRVDQLENGDRVLIAETCSHHAQEDDIGKVKIPRWLKLHTKKDLKIEVMNGRDYPADLTQYKLIVHCGACMITRKATQMRIKQAKIAGVPIVNYGVLISYMHGAMPRAIEPFEEAISVWQEINSD